MQAAVAEDNGAQNDEYSLFSEPIPNERRAMPTNFSEKVLDAYLRLPEQVLPTGLCTGKYNFTWKSAPPLMTKIEVHLLEKRFFVIADDKGYKVTHGGGVLWKQYGSIRKAWEASFEKAAQCGSP